MTSPKLLVVFRACYSVRWKVNIVIVMMWWFGSQMLQDKQ
jgi:hypothetical protein